MSESIADRIRKLHCILCVDLLGRLPRDRKCYCACHIAINARRERSK